MLLKIKLIFWFSQIAAILDFTHDAMSNILSSHTTTSGIGLPEDHVVHIKYWICVHYVENDINL